MSRQNIDRLVELVRSDPDVQKKLREIDRSTLESTAYGLSRLSLEVGCPFSVAEFLEAHYGSRWIGKAC